MVGIRREYFRINPINEKVMRKKKSHNNSDSTFDNEKTEVAANTQQIKIKYFDGLGWAPCISKRQFDNARP